jgi:hypothetical protein
LPFVGLGLGRLSRLRFEMVPRFRFRWMAANLTVTFTVKVRR